MSLIEQKSIKTEFVILGKTYENNNYLTMHNVRNGKIGEEVPFTKKTAMGIFSIFEEYAYIPKQFSGIVPKNIIYARDTPTQGLQLTWTVKSTKKKLMFSPSTGLSNGMYSIPSLVFNYKKSCFSVYAICDSDYTKINEYTVLYHAPFLNVFNQGNICMGNVRLGKIENLSTFEACTSFLESAFFNSIFTHSNNRNVVSSKSVEQEKDATRWNTNNLHPTQKTIKSII